MRMLITSGGTTIPIDPVRNITNSSTGRFGAQLAESALMEGKAVTYLTSSNGRSPFSCNIDFYENNNFDIALSKLKQIHSLAEKYRHHYIEYRYKNFAEYAELLNSIVKQMQPDVVILNAAVSDYLVSNYSQKKIRSNEDLTIYLKTAPKLIHYIKEWSARSFVVGFKLLVDDDDEKLIAAAKDNMAKHNLDLVVANNLSSLKRGAHEVIVIDRNGASQKYTENLASTIIRLILNKVNE